MAIIEGPEFTFTPGALKGANIYGDWAALMARIAAQPCRRPVISFTEDFTIPAGTWDLKFGILKGAYLAPTQITITVPDGAVLDNLSGIDNGLTLECTHTAVGDTLTFSANPVGFPKNFNIGSLSSVTNLGTQPLITAGMNERVYVGFLGAINATMLAPLVRGGHATATILAFDIGLGCALPDGWVDGVGTLLYQAGAYQNLPSIPGWVGTGPSINYSALSQNVKYSPAVISNWGIPTPNDVKEALDQIGARTTMEVLAGLSVAGVWFPNEFIGPFYPDQSAVGITGFASGAGFYRVTRAGTLKNFCWTNQGPPGSPIPADVWLAPSGNPSLFAYTGISLTMAAGAYIASNTVDTLDVIPDDIIVLLNPSLIVGYTPGAMTITADFIPKP